MAKGFILGVDLQIQKILGLEAVKQQLAGIQIGGVGQTDKLSTGLKNVGTAAGFAGLSLAKTTKSTVNLGKSAQKTGKQIKGAAKQAKNFGDQIFLAGKRYAAFLGATVAAYKALQLISAGTKSVIEFDQAMVSLSQILEVSLDQTSDLSQQFLDLSVSTGTSAAEIANAAKLLAQAGFRGNELTEAVEQLAKVPLTPIFEGMEQAVDGVIATMRQFGHEGLTVEQIFDKLTKVSLKYAASMPDIIEGIKRGGAAFVAMGGTLDEFVAAFTTIRSVTRESASAVGTSIKTITARLADPAFARFLEARGVRLFEEGQFVGPIEAMRRIGNEMERLGELSEEALEIGVKIGGKRQISRFLALSRNMEKNNRIFEDSKDSSKAFSEATERGLQAIGKQIDILINKAKKLAIDLGEDLFIPFIKGLTGAAEAAIILLDKLKPILPVIAKIGALFAGAAIFKGIGGFIGPRLGTLAGPAAFAAAGGGLRGAGAGLMASPFAQAGLLIAATEAASALIRTAEGADSSTASLVSYTGAIIAMISLLRRQTIAGFLGKGGLLPGFGKVGGGLLTAAAVALPVAGILELQRSQKDLSEKILKGTIKSIDEIKIDPVDPKALQTGFSEFATRVSEGLQQSIDRSDPLAAGIGIGERITRSFAAGLRVLGKALELDFSALFKRGAVTTSDIKERFEEIVEKSPEFINQVIDNISQAMSTTPLEKLPSGRYALTQLARQQGATEEEAKLFTKTIINASGGLKEFDAIIDKNIAKISEEIEKREKLAPLIKAFLPPKLVGQLFQFSKAVDKVTRTVDLSARMFAMQIAEIEGGIRQPTFEFDFGAQQIKKFITAGGLEELFAFTPDIPKFIGGLTEVENLLDQFIINISNLPTGIDLSSEIEKFFEFQNVPKIVRDNFEDFFKTIAQDITLVSEGKYIDTDQIKSRFKKEFADLGVGATDAAVESVRGFLEATFSQIQDELNRLATIRKFELAAPVRPETQAAFLEQQLRRVGIRAGGGPDLTNVLRGTLEELDLLRREFEARGRIGAVPGLLPTPSPEFFEGRGAKLADIAGDERIRQQVRDSFQKVVTESTLLKKRLAELKPGAEGFIAASQRAKELARTTIELQTTLEALTQASGRALEYEKRTLTLRQQFELAQKEAILAERVREGRITPLQAERITFEFVKEQERAQIALQDKFDSIIEKDNMLRVNLAKEISANTKTQAEITQNFDTSVNVFADATRMQITTLDLMKQYVADFGQSVVSFSNLGVTGGQIAGEDIARITPTQIRSGGVTTQQAYDEYNRLIDEGNTSQKEMLEILKAILDRQEQVQPIKQESSEIQKEQERDTETNEKIGQLTESLDNLRTILDEPNELKLVTDQRIDLDLSTLPLDISAEIRPILEEAVVVAAKTVTRKALESLAAKSESEVSIAATDTAQELI